MISYPGFQLRKGRCEETLGHFGLATRQCNLALVKAFRPSLTWAKSLSRKVGQNFFSPSEVSLKHA
ncbi:MAG: hypothetical protein M3505_02095, partial [Verrucomicrobiota bacterium]|nr:hypothetical protein [Verrucomicrobiota bacterium]